MSRRLAVVLVDFENVKRNATVNGGLVDFEKLRDIITEEIGEILFSFVFIPDHKDEAIGLPPDINDRGFEIVVCQRTKDTDKLEDTVDVHIIKMGIKFCNFEEVSNIVIVGHDGHMSHLVSEAKNRKKRITIIGIKELMSRILTKVVDSKDIYSLPIDRKNIKNK